MILLLPVIVPIAAGLLLLALPVLGARPRVRAVWVLLTLAVTMLLVFRQIMLPDVYLHLWDFSPYMPVVFRVDKLARLFAGLTVCIWLPAGVFALDYMRHEGGERRFFGVYLTVLGILIGLDFSGNLLTFYVFYELVTLSSTLLVLHSMTHEAIMAGLKYLFYSVAGAFLALFGIFFLCQACQTIAFLPGGSLPAHLLPAVSRYLPVVLFVMLLGFSAKAGMFPLHGWLPTAHPVAPAPASAILSGVITKCGVLATVRTIYYVVGPDYLRGTWVQHTFLILTLITVLMGSMMAYYEPVLKKRLAYSTVSQVSYVLFGVWLLTPAGLTGALSHAVFHAVVKSGLFLAAGAFIFQTGRTRANELRGVGARMPITLWCFTLFGLALVGIPPASGFVSKWLLASGALEADIGALGWIGPAVLLASALLTAGYLFPVSARGFFPGKGFESGLTCREASSVMAVPLVILAAFALGLGIFTQPLAKFLFSLVSELI